MAPRFDKGVKIVLLACALCGCAPVRDDPWVLSRLYFGQQRGAERIAPAEFEAFVAAELTPAFPAGFTRYTADGQWRDPAGRILREPTVIVEIVHRATSGDDAKLARLAADYRRRFAQDAVLRVDVPIATPAF
ncbi:MAG: DUF3574 domain-containing protein [Gammaproteobacteria bacterium]|nr:DUF3574 domain-containing protein [Gammaproteobacteria bacterium]